LTSPIEGELLWYVELSSKPIPAIPIPAPPNDAEDDEEEEPLPLPPNRKKENVFRMELEKELFFSSFSPLSEDDECNKYFLEPTLDRFEALCDSVKNFPEPSRASDWEDGDRCEKLMLYGSALLREEEEEDAGVGKRVPFRAQLYTYAGGGRCGFACPPSTLVASSSRRC